MHPSIMDATNPDQIQKFIQDVETTEADWVTISTEFFMIHSRLDHWKKTMGGRYNNNMQAVFDDLWKYLISNIYTVAGFQNGNNLMPSEKTMALCQENGIDCTSSRHRPPGRIQHAIFDTVAMCGALCAGNPFDSGGPFSPIGWGEAHEMGHNLQNHLLKIYGGKTQEVSNNIYPYVLYQKYNEDHTNDSNKMLTRGLNGLTTQNREPAAFTIIKQSLSQSNPKEYVKNAIW